MNHPRTIILSALLAAALTTLAQERTISSVESQGVWYYVYDQNGKRMHTLSASSTGQLVGYSSRFFIFRNGAWYYLYNANGKRYKTLSVSSTGEITGVAGETFTARLGSWIYTYSKDGKRISTRAAH